MSITWETIDTIGVIFLAVWLIIFIIACSRANKARARRMDPYELQALEDQKTARRPGCWLGTMACCSITCGCNGACPSTRFVSIRAKRLRAGLNSEWYSVSDEKLP